MHPSELSEWRGHAAVIQWLQTERDAATLRVRRSNRRGWIDEPEIEHLGSIRRLLRKARKEAAQ